MFSDSRQPKRRLAPGEGSDGDLHGGLPAGSRAARWLRNKMYHGVCQKCAIPQWKLEKHSSSRCRRKYGAELNHGQEGE